MSRELHTPKRIENVEDRIRENYDPVDSIIHQIFTKLNPVERKRFIQIIVRDFRTEIIDAVQNSLKR